MSMYEVTPLSTLIYSFFLNFAQISQQKQTSYDKNLFCLQPYLTNSKQFAYYASIKILSIIAVTHY